MRKTLERHHLPDRPAAGALPGGVQCPDLTLVRGEAGPLRRQSAVHRVDLLQLEPVYRRVAAALRAWSAASAQPAAAPRQFARVGPGEHGSRHARIGPFDQQWPGGHTPAPPRRRALAPAAAVGAPLARVRNDAQPPARWCRYGSWGIKAGRSPGGAEGERRGLGTDALLEQ